jgi:tricorn protease
MGKRCEGKLTTLIQLLLFAVITRTCLAQAQKPPDPSPSTRQQTFEKAWQVVRDGYYDPKLKGVDWKAAHDRYAPKVDQVKSDEEFYDLLREMLGLLGDSHLGVMPPWDYLDQDATPATSAKQSAAPVPLPTSPVPAAAETGEYGMEIEVVEGSEVVTQVDPGSAAAVAGVKPGYVVLQIRDTDVREIARSLDASHKSPVRRDAALNDQVSDLLAGWAGDTIVLKVLDENDDVRSVNLVLQHPTGTPCHSEGMPTEYAKFDAKLLPGSVAYIHFNAFETPVLESVTFAMSALATAKAMIVDLRGNTGGDDTIGAAVAGHLVRQQLNMGEDVGRTAVDQDTADPLQPRFDGPVAVLIDERTACASEMLAVSLQEAGRAIVVGQRSCGECETGATAKLPDNSRIEYPSYIYKAPKGEIIEGVGVKPDVEVAVTRKDLLAGKDPVREAAIRALLKKQK